MPVIGFNPMIRRLGRAIASLLDQAPGARTDPVRERLSALLGDVQATLSELTQENEDLLTANRQLRRDFRRYVERFDSAPIGRFETDNLAVIQEANRRAAGLLGVAEPRLLSRKPLSLFISPDGLRSFRTHLDGINMGGELNGWEAEVLPAQGSAFLASFSAIPARDPEGHIAGIHWLFTDITDRNHAETALRESQAQLDLLVNHLPAIVWMTDSALRITSYRGASLSSLELDGAEMVGLTMAECLGTDDPAHPAMVAHVRALRGEPATYETKISNRFFEAHLEPVRDAAGGLIGCLGLALDVTERRAAFETTERSLRREKEAVKRLEALDRMREAVLATMSHDFQVPLAVILGMADLLERRQDLEAADRKLFASRIGTQANKLSQLLRDLVTSATVPGQIAKKQRKPTDLGPLVQKIACEWNEGEHTLIVETEDVVAHVDPVLVERIVENLIANAEKHTPPGTPLWVRVLKAKEGALIQVDDAGNGVPDYMKESIFEAFKRSASGASSAGMGMGLHLVSRFAELHGGRAWVEDRPGAGASFRVLLPTSPGRPGKLSGVQKKRRDAAVETPSVAE